MLVLFIVEKDGSISNAEVSWGVDPSLDQEALRIVNKMPKWKPGTQKWSCNASEISFAHNIYAEK